ncbi:MAG: rhomboid family intramembrane serine protease [Lentimicrobiaceae bacterium]|nr:rhomboid family intramembrane serine protease [Lentimicrobiaceae bacterium]
MKEEKREIIVALIYPLAFVALLWVVYFIGNTVEFDLALLGIHPLDVKSLTGILTAPLIHLDFDHISGNSLSFIVIGFGLCFLYKRRAFPIFLFIYIASGLWGWFFARGGYHIGASGLIYGMFFFLITSALIKREKRTIAFSLLITFLYGAIVWGFFPVFFPNKNISWEIHTTGAIAGIIAAFYFREDGPQKEILPDEEDNEQEEENPYWKKEPMAINE